MLENILKIQHYYISNIKALDIIIFVLDWELN